MRTAAAVLSRRRDRTLEGSIVASARQLPMASVAIGSAWLIVVLAQLTGNAAALHHHALIEDGPPLWIAMPLFLVAWLVMIAAMMLPASLPAIRVAALATPILARPRRDLAAFVGPMILIWTLFGLLAFLGDDLLHHVVDATPWLAARPWLIEMAVVATAGAYQLAPLKHRSLDACRHAGAAGTTVMTPGAALVRAGVDHALACLGSSWALMLLMFAEGFANLWWMGALAALMVYEATGQHGQRAARAAGLFLLGYAAIIALVGWRTS